MTEAAIWLVMVARFAAGGLLIVAAIGKLTTLGSTVNRQQAIVLVSLSIVELVAGVGLLLPVSGLPSAAAAMLFLGFAGAQAVGRSLGERRPCGCYGTAAPNAVFSYGAVVTFIALAAGIAMTTIVDLPMDGAAQALSRIMGLALAILIIALIRRGPRPVSGQTLPESQAIRS